MDDLQTGNQLSYFKHFYTSLQWWKLVPRFNDSVCAEASRSLLSSDGQDTYVVFFFGGGTSTGALKQMENHFTYVAKWFNPRNGKYTNISIFRPKENQWVILDSIHTWLEAALAKLSRKSDTAAAIRYAL